MSAQLTPEPGVHTETVLDLGWGRLVFGQTFDDIEKIGDVLRDEATGRRDICMYLSDAHILVALHPQEYFIDPSHTMRRPLEDYRNETPAPAGVLIREVEAFEDCEVINRIYVRCGMVPAAPSVMWANHVDNPAVTYLVAVDESTGEMLGTVTGIDHALLFGDPDGGSSLWCLAVDPSATRPGVGTGLVHALLDRYADAGRRHMDLSVIHSNSSAITLYSKLGFGRVPVFGLKRKNAINEPLFSRETTDYLSDLGPYARIISDEAIRRGIRVTVLDSDTGYMELEHGGRTVITRESLSQYTTAVAMSRCEDKRVSRKVVERAGVRVPRGQQATFGPQDEQFLREVGSLVVKPVRGEQGHGITIGVNDPEELRAAIARAGGEGTEILLEEFSEGEDLRILVIDGRVVAAAIRRPASVVGTGRHTVSQLVEAQSRRRNAQTGGEARIPLDDVTATTVREEGYELGDVPPEGTRIQVRRTANLHTGGTIHDVTDRLHPALASAAIACATEIGIPVTGIDFLVPDVSGSDYVFIEANERPGLANHEPQPVAAAFLDYLFPNTRRTPWAWQPSTPQADQHQTGK